MTNAWQLEATYGQLAVYVDDLNSVAEVRDRWSNLVIKRARGKSSWRKMCDWARDNHLRYSETEDD